VRRRPSRGDKAPDSPATGLVARGSVSRDSSSADLVARGSVTADSLAMRSLAPDSTLLASTPAASAPSTPILPALPHPATVAAPAAVALLLAHLGELLNGGDVDAQAFGDARAVHLGGLLESRGPGEVDSLLNFVVALDAERDIRRVVAMRPRGQFDWCTGVIVMGREPVVPSGNSPDAGAAIQRRCRNVWMNRAGPRLLSARHASLVCQESAGSE